MRPSTAQKSTMKYFIPLFILFLALVSCKNSEKTIVNPDKQELPFKKDYSFLTDSLHIEEQLIKHHLAGFSLAVFENYEIVYTNHWGLKSTNSNEKIDNNTAFSNASISKPITALLCHIL